MRRRECERRRAGSSTYGSAVVEGQACEPVVARSTAPEVLAARPTNALRMGTSEAGQAGDVVARAATPRALLIGALVSVFVNVASPYTESVGFSNCSWSYLPEGAMVPFLLLLVLNAAAGRFSPRWALRIPELLFVFVMALAANCTSIFLMYFLCSALISPHYFATAENRWADELLPYLRPWLIVSDENRAAYWFYEGLPPGASLPWRDWAVPVAAWLPLLVALLVGSFSMVGLLRRQWLDHEKLSYPLMRLPLELVGRGPVSAGYGAVTRCRSFWVAAAIPLCLSVADLARGIWPSFPAPIVDHLGSLHLGVVTPGAHFSPLTLNINFLALSSGFFVPTDVLFGVWSLYLLVKLVQEPLINRLGLGTGSAGMFVWGQASTSWQSFGAFMVMVVGVLGGARRHLAGLWEQAAGGRGEEAASARTCLIGFSLAMVVMAAWLVHSGMPGAVAVAFLALAMAMYLGVARIVCQTGIFYLVPAMIGQNPIIYALGPDTIGRQGMISLALSYAWHGDVQTVLAGLAAEGMKVEQQARFRRGELSLAMLSSACVGLLAAPIGIILSAYPRGALSWNTWVYRGWGPSTYGQVLGQIGAGQKRDYFNAVYFTVGALAMWGLSALRSHFAWWPLHPIGLAAVSSFTIYAVYIPFLLAWMVKLSLLRWAGLRAYHAATPLFIGLGVGHYLARAVALVGYTALGIRWTV